MSAHISITLALPSSKTSISKEQHNSMSQCFQDISTNPSLEAMYIRQRQMYWYTIMGTKRNSDECHMKDPNSVLVLHDQTCPSRKRMMETSIENNSAEHSFRQVKQSRKEANVYSSSTERKRPFRCLECPSRFTVKGHLSQHVRYVHHKWRPHKCTQPGCSSSFGTQFARSQHIWTVHERKKPFVCPKSDCNSSFGQRSHLNRHIKRHNEVDGR